MSNKLSLTNIKSNVICSETSINLNNQDDLLSIIKNNFSQKGYFLAYLHHKVIIGKFDGEKFQTYENEEINPKDLLKIRVFNDIKELYIWKSSLNKFSYRIRIDGKGESTDVVIANQVIWGTKSRKLEKGWSKLTEDRGMEIILPIEIDDLKDKIKRVKIKTINYIGTNCWGQAGYIDSRFVKFGVGGEIDD